MKPKPNKGKFTLRERLFGIRNLCVAVAAGILLANSFTFFVAPKLFTIITPDIEITKTRLFIPGFSNTRIYSGESGISGRFAESIFDPEPAYSFRIEKDNRLVEMITLPQNSGTHDASVITFYFNSTNDPLLAAFEGWRRPDPRFFDTSGIRRFGWREVPGPGRRLEFYLEPNEPQPVSWIVSWIHKSLTGESDLARNQFVYGVVADTEKTLPLREHYSVILSGQLVGGDGPLGQSVTAIPAPDNYNTDGFWWMML